MKAIFLCLPLLSWIMSYSQKSFEGWIHYKATPEKEYSIEGIKDKGDSLVIQIGFTKGKILIRSSKESEEDLLIFLILQNFIHWIIKTIAIAAVK